MPQPNKIPRPFADSGDKNSIPDSSGSIGFASWQEGFPSITSEPFASGGVAPKRADFNGIFNALSAATVWNQQGGVYAYDATTDYEVGNIVEYSGDLYKCITANGPSSTVKSPTDATVWAKVILTTATQSNAGYMSAADKTALDSVTDKDYTLVSSGNVSVPDNTGTDITSYTFTKTGVYLVCYSLNFRKVSTTGYRQLVVSATSGGSTIDQSAVIASAPPSASYCFVQLSRIEKITSVNTSRYLIATQTTGQTIDVSGQITIARLGDA